MQPFRDAVQPVPHQAVDVLAPVTLTKVPAGAPMQLAAEMGEYEPRGQAVHAALPTSCVLVPGGHWMQLALPVLGW